MNSNNHIWRPCGYPLHNMAHPPLAIHHAAGSYLHLTNGHKIIDAIGSWWCKQLGHNHPSLKQALFAQAERYEHAIHANTSCDVLEQLATGLCQFSPQISKVFFAGDGSCAVEVAMKLSLHHHRLLGQTQRKKFIALQHGYHGETSGAMSVSDLGKYLEPYDSMLFDSVTLQDLPYVSGRTDPLWHDCAEYWPAIEAQLAPWAHTATAVIVEPIVQGAAGMLLYSPDLLRRLRQWCTEHGVHLIADEIMTGMGRTGLPLASSHANVAPDFILLSKGLTSGWMPFSAVLIHEQVHQCFVETGEAFWHSHTYDGNPLGASIALACLQIFDEKAIYPQTQHLEKQLWKRMQHIAEATKQLTNIRGIGAVMAADLMDTTDKEMAEICQHAIQLGALLRPLGHTLYWCPPLNIDEITLDKLTDITIEAIGYVKKSSLYLLGRVSK